MKKLFLTMLVICMLLAAFPVTANAAGYGDGNDIIWLDNGCYITIETYIYESRAASTKSASRNYTCTDSNGAELWKATLYGTFTYTGTTSTCTASSCTVSITNDAWYTISKTASKSGNAATADVVMGKKFLGIKIDEESVSMRLTCDANGNLS